MTHNVVQYDVNPTQLKPTERS